MREESRSPAYILCDGEMLPADSRVLPVTDGALAFGAGLFETIAAYHGKPFAWEKHLIRLRGGMDALGISLSLPDDLEKQSRNLLEKNELSDSSPARIRITVTAGSEMDHPHWIMEATPAPSHTAAAGLITGPFVRNEHSLLAGFKTINYGDNVIAMQRARAAGMTEALFANTQGNICEGTWSNFFFYHEGKWKSPPVASGCLPGVTRATVLEVAKQSGIEIVESDLAISRIDEIEAAFLTSTMRGVQPVLKIDDHGVRVTHDDIWKLASAYSKFVIAR